MRTTSPLAQPLYCSFCGKQQGEVARLIAGPTCFICNECVDLCQNIFSGHLPDAGKLSLAQEKGDVYAVKALAETSITYRSDGDLPTGLRELAGAGPVLFSGYVLLSRRDWDRLVVLTLGLDVGDPPATT